MSVVPTVPSCTDKHLTCCLLRNSNEKTSTNTLFVFSIFLWFPNLDFYLSLSYIRRMRPPLTLPESFINLLHVNLSFSSPPFSFSSSFLSFFYPPRIICMPPMKHTPKRYQKLLHPMKFISRFSGFHVSLSFFLKKRRGIYTTDFSQNI